MAGDRLDAAPWASRRQDLPEAANRLIFQQHRGIRIRPLFSTISWDPPANCCFI